MLYLDALKFEPVANIINKYIKNRKLVLLGDSLNLRNLLFEKYQNLTRIYSYFSKK